MSSRSKQSRAAAQPVETSVLAAPGSSSAYDPERIQRIEALVRLLDEAIRIPGTRWRFGLDSILGLVPGAGDLASLLVSAYILKESAQMGASRTTLARMLGNLAVDFAVGSVPLVGDVFDVAFKANRRNMTLLQKHLMRTAKQNPSARPHTREPQ